MSAEPVPLQALDARRARRDPAVVHDGGVFHCFHTVVDTTQDPPALRVESTTSRDLVAWSDPRVVIGGPANFSSPGNVLRHGDEWVMFLQSYPIDPGEQYGSARCRLWSARSTDLISWSAPTPLRIEGPGADARRIDPFVFADGDVFRCLHKHDGAIAELESPDLEVWRVRDGRALLTAADTPEGVPIENPAALRLDDELALVYSPCRPGRGIGLARGHRDGEWREVRSLTLPTASWAVDGFTAGVLVDTGDPDERWALFVHGEQPDAHGAALAVLRRADLEHWR